MDLVAYPDVFAVKFRKFVSQSPPVSASEADIAAIVVAGMAHCAGDRTNYGGAVCVRDGALWAYSGVKYVWREVPDSLVVSAIWLTDTLETTSGDVVHMTSRKAVGVLSAAKHIIDLNLPYLWNSAPIGVPFANRFVRLDETGRLVAEHHNPEHWTTETLPYAWDDRALCPKFMRFLDDLFRDDTDAPAKIAALQQFIGLCLVGAATRSQKCLVLLGGGANGKSALLRVIEGLFPREAMSHLPPQEMTGFKLWSLEGKRINIAGDIPKARLDELSVFKAIVTGDPVSVDRKYKDVAQLIPRAGHVFATNDPPTSESDFAEGYFRRFLFITFNRSFLDDPTRRDTDELVADLLTEAPGIIRLFMQGASDALRTGFVITPPPSHHEAAGSWRCDVDQVAEWKSERTEPPMPSDFESYERIYADYGERWVNDSGRKRLSKRMFLSRLRGLGFREVRSGKHGTKGLNIRIRMTNQ